MLLTVLAPKVREQQQIGHPNPVLERLIKLGLKIQFDLIDIMPDPVKPMLFEEYQAVKKWGWGQIDADVTRQWERKGRVTDFCLVVVVTLWAVMFLWYK